MRVTRWTAGASAAALLAACSASTASSEAPAAPPSENAQAESGERLRVTQPSEFKAAEKRARPGDTTRPAPSRAVPARHPSFAR